MNQDRAVKLEMFGNTYYLLFTGEAMFELSPQGQTFNPDAFVETMLGFGPDAFSALCNAVVVLSTKGELVRRDYGYDPGVLVTTDYIRQNAMPFDISAMQMAVVDSVYRGLLREVPNAEKTERDKGLEKLNKKKETP